MPLYIFFCDAMPVNDFIYPDFLISFVLIPVRSFLAKVYWGLEKFRNDLLAAILAFFPSYLFIGTPFIH